MSYTLPNKYLKLQRVNHFINTNYKNHIRKPDKTYSIPAASRYNKCYIDLFSSPNLFLFLNHIMLLSSLKVFVMTGLTCGRSLMSPTNTLSAGKEQT